VNLLLCLLQAGGLVSVLLPAANQLLTSTSRGRLTNCVSQKKARTKGKLVYIGSHANNWKKSQRAKVGSRNSIIVVLRCLSAHPHCQIK
jgi:hypothetical protein